MHEFFLTSQIVKVVREEAEKRDAKKVLEVHLIIGKLTLLGIEQVRFIYKLLTKGSTMEGSKLFVEYKKGKVSCNKCGYTGAIQVKDDLEYHVFLPSLICPKCGSVVKIIEGQECLIKSVKMVI